MLMIPEALEAGDMIMVRKERLELSRVAPQAPKASASTNSATFAKNIGVYRIQPFNAD